VRSAAAALACLLLVSCRTAPAEPSEGIPRKTLLTFFRQTASEEFCRADGYFRSCFELSAAECIATADESVAGCIAQYESELPEVVEQSVAMPWAVKVGGCAGTGFEIVRAAKKIASDRCADANLWAEEALGNPEPTAPPPR
jgi:hypothetical protein